MALAQGGRGGRGTPTPTAKASAPIDLTGYWTSVITEDWHVRMLSAPKGARGRIPFNAEGLKAVMKWDPAADEAEGNQCKAYGAPGVMRQPTHLHISWQDDNTLRLEADFGTQTRVFHFVPPPQGGRLDYVSGAYVPPAQPKMDTPPGIASSWPGYSIAFWNVLESQPHVDAGGDLTVRTTHLKPGYYWKNGMPYSGGAMLTEHFRVMDLPDNPPWIVLTQIVDDPEYLSQPFVVNYQFKKLPDGSKWNPTPCVAK